VAEVNPARAQVREQEWQALPGNGAELLAICGSLEHFMFVIGIDAYDVDVIVGALLNVEHGVKAWGMRGNWELS
jgi:hypothetical protein